MNSLIKQYLSVIGSHGGKKGLGAVKARTSEQARAAANVRWTKNRKKKSVH